MTRPDERHGAGPFFSAIGDKADMTECLLPRRFIGPGSNSLPDLMSWILHSGIRDREFGSWKQVWVGQAWQVLTRFHIVTVAFALLFPISGTTFAAQGSRHSRSAVVKHHSVTTSRADVSQIRAFAPGGTSRYPYGPGVNFPYPDRPYGDPGRW
jgi:hypothetical protein